MFQSLIKKWKGVRYKKFELSLFAEVLQTQRKDEDESQVGYTVFLHVRFKLSAVFTYLREFYLTYPVATLADMLRLTDLPCH